MTPPKYGKSITPMLPNANTIPRHQKHGSENSAELEDTKMSERDPIGSAIEALTTLKTHGVDIEPYVIRLVQTLKAGELM